MFHVVGTEMDWIDDGLSAEFKFVNPNAVGECGCGESFHVSPNVAREIENANAKADNEADNEANDR